MCLDVYFLFLFIFLLYHLSLYLSLSFSLSLSLSGFSHTCALFSNGRVRCWGGGENGVIGANSTLSSLSPSRMHTHAPYLSFSHPISHLISHAHTRKHPISLYLSHTPDISLTHLISLSHPMSRTISLSLSLI